MKCLQLKLKRRNRLSDPEFLARAPLLPNQHLFKKQGFNLGLMKREEEDPLLLISDHDGFIEQYRNYYEARFEIEEKPEDFTVPFGYEVVYGVIKFENETAPEEGDLEEEPEL